MNSNTKHTITHRMVPLICQALITQPEDEAVWLEGFHLLSNPKLQSALALSSSIWLPLLLKGLEPTKPRSVITSALKLLLHVSDSLQPTKSCLLRPLRVLAKEEAYMHMEELALVIERFGLMIWDQDKMTIATMCTSHCVASTTTPIYIPSKATPPQHPLLAEILAHNLPPKTRTIQHAWTQTLLSSAHDNPSIWLHNLFQATLEACGIPEMVVTSRLGSLIHEDLFQTAFVKGYSMLEENQPFKKVVDNTLVALLNDNGISKEITVMLLDLLAFLNKDRRQVPRQLTEAAQSCALNQFNGPLNQPLPGIVLWYMEQQAETFPTWENVSNLVETNIRVGSSGYDAAWSTLLWLQNDWQLEPDPMWITQLSHWKQGLAAQDKLDKSEGATSFASFNTRMICYHALGSYNRGYELAQNLFEGLNDWERRSTAHWATAAAWHMGDFDTMADYLAFHPKGTSKSLYKAIIDVHNGQYASAFHHIGKAQSLSYDELQMQLGVGPQAALKSLAKTEFLVELQEVIQYKSQPESREGILTTWKSRFKRSHADANSWLKRLEVWALACPPTTFHLRSCYLNTAKLCESAGMQEAAQQLIARITPPIREPGCKVEYTQLRFQWKSAFQEHNEAGLHSIFNKLHAHTHEYMAHIGLDSNKLEEEGLGLQPLTVMSKYPRLSWLILARRYQRLADWTAILQGSQWPSDENAQVLRYISLSSKLDPGWFSASFALAERSMTLYEAGGFAKADPIAVSSYIVPALRGLFQAARTKESPEHVIKALLRLVTLWFRFGESSAVILEIEYQLNLTEIEPWLAAIPQLIARLGTPHRDLQLTLINLLKDIATQYPHAIIWPLLTATQTQKREHQKAARVVMDFICTMPDGARLVAQAELVGKELIRTSISWTERWRNIIDHCLQIQELMEVAWHDIPQLWKDDIDKLMAPETPEEEQFVQQYGEQLLYVYKCLEQYKAKRQLLHLVNTAYTELYRLYVSFDAHLSHWRVPGVKLSLASTAPKLLSLRDCILTVPGQYEPSLRLDDQAFIDSFAPMVDVVSSKQLPRKLVIRSYVNNYTFLLKGNEDLRGDERIMQLFGLINTLLNHNSEAFSRNLHLLPYEVVPLSPSAGLVSWVPNTQQLQSIVQANRDKDKKSNLSNKERASLLGYDPETFDPNHERPRFDPQAEMDRYDKLPLSEKVERLKAALAHSNQSDLKDALWQRSPSSEVWIRRRANFARTIGVASFVGHVIGLGDRHGSNILVDQLTWGALHIDFGDLFEVAQNRSMWPEKVPFRLTKMMITAFELASRGGMETPGSRGTFKQSSLISMEVLRDSRSSLLAMLEAFLYDPLLSWTAKTEVLPEQDKLGGNTQLHPTVSIDMQAKRTRASTHVVAQSIAPFPRLGGTGDSDVFKHIENSLVTTYLDQESFVAKVSGGAQTNARALQVLGQIEKKLIGYNKNSEQPLAVKHQVQELIVEATDLKNLSQGYVLGWIPQW